MIVSAGNSIRFYQDKPNQLPNFDNRPLGALVNSPKTAYIPKLYMQENYSIWVQCLVPGTNLITIEPNSNYQLGAFTLVKVVVLGGVTYRVLDVEIQILTGNDFEIVLYATSFPPTVPVTVIDTWISPCITTVTQEELVSNGYLNIKYFSTTFNTFIDYSSDLVSEFWIRADMFEYNPDSEITEFSNSEANIKLNETLKRNLVFKAGNIVSQQVEQLKIAMKSEYLLINDIQYTQLEDIEISYINNYADVVVPITQVGIYSNIFNPPSATEGIGVMVIEDTFVVS